MTHTIPIIPRHLPATVVVGILAVVLAAVSGCGGPKAGGRPAAGAEHGTENGAAAEAEGGADPLAPVEDTAGLLAIAERLCAVHAGTGAWSIGVRAARRAFSQSTDAAPAATSGAACPPASPKARAATALARCTAYLADWEADPEAMLELAKEGVAAAGAAPGDPVAAYYGAVNLGLDLRSRGASALTSLSELEKMLGVARSAPDTELGGPLRVLGMLYLRAPPWPAGPGDHEQALTLLQEAAKSYPSHPANHLFYANALKEVGHPKDAEDELERAEALAAKELWGAYADRWREEIAKARH